jgi:pyochelin synthetase
MAQMAAKLRDAFSADTPALEFPFDTLLQRLLTHPTVAGLAEFVRSCQQERAAPADSDTTTPAQTQHPQSNAVLTSYGGGESGPLRVVFHAVLGTMNNFHPLLAHLDEQKLGPVIGISVADTERYCSAEAPQLIDQMGEDYSQRLLDTGHREVQLIGYSLGGFIAVEVARRLLEKGLDVVDLVVIDLPPMLFDVKDELILEALFLPNLNIALEQTGLAEVDQKDLLRGLTQLVEDNSNHIPAGVSVGIAGDDGLNSVGKLFRRLAALSRHQRFNLYVETVEKNSGENMPVEMAEGLFKVFRQSFQAANFTPLPFIGDIRYFQATDPVGFLPGTDAKAIEFWEEICLGDLTITKVEGNHYSCIVEKSNVCKLSKLLAVPFLKVVQR